MRASLAFAQDAPSLESSDGLAARIRVEARRERVLAKSRLRRQREMRSIAKGLAMAACLVVVATVYFGVASTPLVPSQGGTADQLALPAMSGGQTGILAIHAQTYIDSLSKAIQGRPAPSTSPREAEQHRVVLEREIDLAAARSALQRNPGSTRAHRVERNNLTRQAETLKSLYMKRSL